MSPAADTQRSASAKSSKLGGKEFEETFKPKSRDGSAKEPEGKKGKKKKAGFPKLIIIIMIIVVLLGGAGTALYFSGMLNPVLAKAGLIKASPGISLADQQAALDKKAADLVAKESTLNELQKKLDAQQATAAASASAAAASPSVSPTFETLLTGLSTEKLTELQQVGSIYSKMDPTAAVAIMTKIYDTKQIAVIIYYMQPAVAALVLAKLDPTLAANVTKLLTN